MVAGLRTPVYKPGPEVHVLEVEGLTKRYGSRTAVDGIQFHVKKGEIVGFLGPNGAGKSTTLRMITGFLAPSGGRIRVAGVDALSSPQEARRHIGYMPEGVPLYLEMRVFEYLGYRAALKGIPRRDVAKATDRALEQAQITDVRDRIIGQLSKGYRQRVGLADALIADPPLLILDEPTSGLDPNQIRSIRDLISGFAGEKTVLLSTHILPEVEAVCGRVLIINKGNLVGEGKPGELRGLGHPFRGGRARQRSSVRFTGAGTVEAFDKALSVLDARVELDGDGTLVNGLVQLDGEDAPELVFSAVAEAGLRLRELRTIGTSLEDVFATLTTDEAAEEEE
ncbi:MAG: ATP-binding cassette domain-containing protein [Myxococcota bacterium]